MYIFIVNTWQPAEDDRSRLLLGRLLLLGQVLDDLLLLGLETLFSALACLLRLGTTSFGLVAVRREHRGVKTTIRTSMVLIKRFS